MALRNPRSKVVNFRLSDGEYESVYCACHAEGARSVSDFARSSVLRRVQGDLSESAVAALLVSLSQAIAKLEQELSGVLQWVRLEKEKAEQPELRRQASA